MNSSNSARGQTTDWCCADHPNQAKCAWSPLNIALMVIGYVMFWPIGLLIMFGLFAGIRPMELPGRLYAWFASVKGQVSNPFKSYFSDSGNRVFDEYQQTQLDRIEEIKGEVRERADRFSNFKGDEERRREQEQFDRFMGRQDKG